MKTLFKSILVLLLIAFIVIQFFGIDKSVPDTSPESDFIAVYSPPSEVESILKSACYDCHSNETIYPWYSNIQPVGWWLQDHIDHARNHVNFSTWSEYSQEDKTDILEELAEEVDEGGMPLESYTWIHEEARLTDQQRETLVNWTENLQVSHNDATTGPSDADDDIMD